VHASDFDGTISRVELLTDRWVYIGKYKFALQDLVVIFLVVVGLPFVVGLIMGRSKSFSI
jgi:hypothetical protein